MAASAKDFPNTSWKNVSEPVSSEGFTGSPNMSGLNLNIGDLSNLTRFAGGLGSLLGGGSSVEDYIKEATKTLRKQAQRQTKKIDKRIENIYPELTGLTGQEALNRYYEAFANTADRVAAMGRADLGVRPDISSEYDRLNTRVQDIQNQYSLAGRLGGYERLALDPPVVSLDAEALKNVIDYVPRGGGDIAPGYKAYYQYSDPQTQQFLYGSRNTGDAIGRYYNNSADVSGLMSYGGLG